MKTHRFEDFDEFANSVAGIESKMLMRQPARRSWTINHVQAGGMEIQVGQLGSGNIAGGQVRDDTYIVYLPLTRGIEYKGNGEPIDHSAFCIIEPGSEFCISTKVQHDWAAAFIPTHLLPDSIIDACSRRCHVTESNSRVATQFRRLVSELMSAALAHGEFESTRAAEAAGQEVKRLVSLIAGEPTPDENARGGRPRVSRDEIVYHVLEYLDQRPGHQFQVAELTAVSEVSERTLRSAFHEFFGVGPTQYLRIRKLNEVHRALKAADPEEQAVTEILADHGVWAFGRFASHYRQMFGELPSATLAKSS